jgi:NAD(P)-dependent dehydrogenase (short-subunit alcohol dehydrogenase family)
LFHIKAAVLQFTQTAQLDLESKNFRIYGVCPGIIDKEMGCMEGEANRRAVAQLKGGGQPTRRAALVAKTVVRLLLQTNDESNWLSHLVVDDHKIACVG